MARPPYPRAHSQFPKIVMPDTSNKTTCAKIDKFRPVGTSTDKQNGAQGAICALTIKKQL